MLHRREMLAFAITAVLGPAAPACASDGALSPGGGASTVSPHTSREAPVPPPAAVPPAAGAAGLRLMLDAPLPDHPRSAPAPSTLRAEDYRYDAAPEGAAAAARPAEMVPDHPPVTAGPTLRLTPGVTGPRPGWQMSGRVGPLRWLAPLDSEGETKMRLGGRVKDQPRMPGMGLFNVGIHYNFE